MFNQGLRQKSLFEAIKNKIINNAVVEANYNLKFLLSVNILQTNINSVFFQIKKVKPGTEITIKFADNEQRVMFLSYCLTDAET